MLPPGRIVRERGPDGYGIWDVLHSSVASGKGSEDPLHRSLRQVRLSRIRLPIDCGRRRGEPIEEDPGKEMREAQVEVEGEGGEFFVEAACQRSHSGSRVADDGGATGDDQNPSDGGQRRELHVRGLPQHYDARRMDRPVPRKPRQRHPGRSQQSH